MVYKASRNRGRKLPRVETRVGTRGDLGSEKVSGREKKEAQSTGESAMQAAHEDGGPGGHGAPAAEVL